MMKGLDIAILCCLLLALAGCAQNSFVPCCQRSSVYNSTSGALLASPSCALPDGTVFGGCVPSLEDFARGYLNCTPSSSYCSVNMDECSKRFGCRWSSSSGSCLPQQCGNINDKAECLSSSCTWAEGAPSGTCSGGTVRKSIPICVDDTPTSCINNRCKAMMCGFTSLQPTPPPSSQDWNSDPASATSSMPISDIAKLAVSNLQGTTCTFSTMNQKLFNQVKQSRGSLWVNSFRFGVGNSFSDYDLSHNFFPQSDKLCSPNPGGTVDRYFNYLNLGYDSWCNEVHSFYTCATSGMNFTDAAVCGQYCDKQSNCQAAGGTAYACPESKFAYSNGSECKKQCEAVGNPSMCTDNEADYPFLTEGARFKAKYVADYLVDTWSRYSFDETCRCKEGAGDGCGFDKWDPDYHDYCDDFDPKGGTPQDGPWSWARTTDSSRNILTQYFDMRKFATLDLDSEYYASELKKQYGAGGLDRQLPFECSSSMECYSGRCDYSGYSRFTAVTNAGGVLDVGCKVLADQSMVQHLDCSGSSSNAIYAMTDSEGKVEGVSLMFEPSQSVKDGNGKATNRFTYFVVKDAASPANGLPLFDRCEVAPVEAKYCLYRFDVIFGDKARSYQKLLPANQTTGNCDPVPPQVGYYSVVSGPITMKRYDLDFASMPSFGICQVGSGDKPPYVKLQQFGWCAACTYSTLAVQKITWERNTPSIGYVKSQSCYEWHGESAYNYSLGARVKNDGSIGYEIRSASVSQARPGGQPRRDTSQFDGNIERDDFQCNKLGFSCDPAYGCTDGWNAANGWWPKPDLPTPSAPYLYDKLTTYLSSNVMPVLDVTGTSTYAYIKFEGIGNALRSVGPPAVSTGYEPLGVCTKLGGQGAEIFVVGTTGLLSQSFTPAAGQAYNDAFSENGVVNPNGFAGYISPHAAPGGGQLDGFGAVLVRAKMLKDGCVVPPLVGISIDAADSAGNDPAGLIGTGDLSDPDNPSRGLLHRFFYSDRQSFQYRVKNGQPDKYPGSVDLLLQEWYPTCSGSGSLYERIQREVNGRMDFSRALLGNLSKPSLIWKFHFPSGSGCAGPDGHYGMFTEYLFNNTGNMVDSGIIGIIYDSWMTGSGAGYGFPAPSDQYGGAYITNGYKLNSNLNKDIADGALDNPNYGSLSKNLTPFCELQKNSRKVLGITKTSFGQKVFAGDAGCTCIECTDSDYLAGTCNRNADTGGPSDQHYCNDGSYCDMPKGASDYSKYHCSYTCANASRCELCQGDTSRKSFCLIEPNGGQAVGVTKNYGQITDNYWEWVAGLPAKDKCCLQSSVPDQPVQTYTYVARSGGTQRSEFLQYPARGEQNVDCGRVPDTSVLAYCGIKIPIASEAFKCWKVG